MCGDMVAVGSGAEEEEEEEGEVRTENETLNCRRLSRLSKKMLPRIRTNHSPALSSRWRTEGPDLAAAEERGATCEREREREACRVGPTAACRGDADGRLVIVADFATVRSILEGLCRRRPLLTHDVFRPEVEAPAKEEEKDMVIIRSGKREKIIVPFLLFLADSDLETSTSKEKKKKPLSTCSLCSRL